MTVLEARSRLFLRSAAAAWFALGAAAVTAAAQAPRGDDLMPVGMRSFDIPPAIPRNDTPPRVVQLLADTLAANPHALRRVELVRDLGGCKLKAAAAPLATAASDPEPAVRAEAARSLGLIGDAAAASGPLRKLLADDSPAVRREAVRAGAALNDPTIVATGLADRDESVFTVACESIANPEQAAQVAARLPELSPSAKRFAVRMLGRTAATAHAKLVAGQLASADLPLKIAAVESLGQMKATAEAAAVEVLLDHTHPTVRRAAVTAMASLAGAEQQTLIARQMLNDADPSVRAAAARLLAAHPSLDMVSPLVAQLSHPHGPLHDAARDALVASASVAAGPTVDAATKLLDDVDPRRRADGSFILGRVRSDAALMRHLALLADADWNVVAQAAESLGLIGRTEAAPGLMKLTAGIAKIREGGSIDLAEVEAIGNAFIACGRLGHKPIVEVAKPLIAEKTVYPPAVRVPAIWAAGAASDAADADVAARCLAVYRDTSPFEVEEARFEAAKAIGNMGYAAAVDEMRREAKENPSPNLRWVAHRVAQRLANGAAAPAPYTPPPAPMVADTSIKDLGG